MRQREAMTNAERQRRFREMRATEGLTTVSGLVYEHQAAAVREMLRHMRDHPELEVCTLRDTETGRYVRVT
jgi:hypothetical protein